MMRRILLTSRTPPSVPKAVSLARNPLPFSLQMHDQNETLERMTIKKKKRRGKRVEHRGHEKREEKRPRGAEVYIYMRAVSLASLK